MVLPQLAETFRPLLQPAVFLLLALAFTRLDFAAARQRASRWKLLMLTVGWSMLVMPLAIGLALRLTGVAASYPEYALSIFIATAPPPVMTVVAFAVVMRLDHPLAMIFMIGCAIATPLAAPLVAGFTLETALPLDALTLSLRLGLLLGGSLVLGLIARRLAGMPRIARHSETIDGVNVVLLFVIAVAAMDGVAAAFVTQTTLALFLLATTFGVAFLQIGLTYLACWNIDRVQGFTIALSSGIRNMGLFVVALGAAIPEMTWLYFGIGQFPIYMLPFLFRSVGGRLAAGRDTAAAQRDAT